MESDVVQQIVFVKRFDDIAGGTGFEHGVNDPAVHVCRDQKYLCRSRALDVIHEPESVMFGHVVIGKHKVVIAAFNESNRFDRRRGPVNRVTVSNENAHNFIAKIIMVIQNKNPHGCHRLCDRPLSAGFVHAADFQSPYRLNRIQGKQTFCTLRLRGFVHPLRIAQQFNGPARGRLQMVTGL